MPPAVLRRLLGGGGDPIPEILLAIRDETIALRQQIIALRAQVAECIAALRACRRVTLRVEQHNEHAPLEGTVRIEE